MKNIRTLIILWSVFATTVLFGQQIYTWTGAGDGTNIANAANWSPSGGPPSGANQDTGQWDNQAAGNLIITYNNGLPGTGFGTSGINLVLTTNQAGSVAVVPVGGSTGTIGINDIANFTASAAFSLGDDSANVLNFIGRPAGGIHDFVNNSTAAATIYPNVRWQAGGGAVYTLLFDGTGNWNVTNSLANANNAGMLISKQGSGAMFWNGPSIAGALPNSPINSPITISAGTLVLQWNNTLINNDAITNAGTLIFDAPSQAQTLAGVLGGPGLLQVNNGTLTLQGANTNNGNIVLDGGTLVVNGAENPGVSGPLGVGGTVSFAGGTLQFSVNNTYDYSSRFSTASSQAYLFNPGGQLVTFATGLTSSGGTVTLAGPGTLILAGSNTYAGATAVNAGALVFQGPMSGAGNITVADSAALGVTATNAPLTPATLTVGTSAGAALDFNKVNSTTTAPIAAGALSSAGAVTININSGTFTVGQSYPLLTWTSGAAPTVSLGTLNGFIGNLSFSGSELLLNITGTAFTWTGLDDGSWDTTTANNWIQNGAPATYANGAPALFDDTAAGTTSVTVSGVVLPSSVTVNNSLLAYSITSSSGNDLGGSGALTKNGANTLTMAGGGNTYSGATTVSGGVLSVGALANGGSASDIGASANSAGNLSLNGGTLQYTGGAAGSDRLFTLGASGGTIDSSGSGALDLNNAGSVAFSGAGARALTLTGSEADTNRLAASLADHGGATSLTKAGAGTWVLTGTNTYSGGTTVASGVLQVGAGGATGAIGSGNVTDDGTLDFNTSGAVTVGVVSGAGSLRNDGSGTIILPGNNSYTGGTTINAGTVQVGNGGSTGSLALSSPIVDNGAFVFNSKGTFTLAGFNAIISGTGQVMVKGSGGLFKAIGANTYTGNTTIFAGATFQPCEGNTGALVSPYVTNNGTLKLVRQDTGVFIYSGDILGTGSVLKDLNNTQPGDVTFTGTNEYTGGTFINGGAIILGDGATPGAGSILGNVSMTSNTLQTAASTLEFNRPDDLTFHGNITGVGGVTQIGSGTLTLTGTNNYNGPTTVSAGALVVSAVGGDLDVSGGTLIPGGGGLVGRLTVASNLNITAGAVLASLNTALSPSNTIYSVGGAINNSGGTLELVNFGPRLAVGDTFTIFSKPLHGSALAIVSQGFTVTDNTMVDGSVTVDTVSASPPTNALTATIADGRLNLSWAASYTGLYLQRQVNPLTIGLSTNWVTLPGTDAANSYSDPVMTTSNLCVFYRLAP